MSSCYLTATHSKEESCAFGREGGRWEKDRKRNGTLIETNLYRSNIIFRTIMIFISIIVSLSSVSFISPDDQPLLEKESGEGNHIHFVQSFIYYPLGINFFISEEASSFFSSFHSIAGPSEGAHFSSHESDRKRSKRMRMWHFSLLQI